MCRMTTSAAPLPGFVSPAVGFDQPFEMLDACHERVQRSLNLLRRIVAHIDQNGHDAESASAVVDVLRYFDLAGPHHHEDEERHVFPLLEDHPDALVRAAVIQLQADHREMHALWLKLRQVLEGWREPSSATLLREDERMLIDAFVAAYARHIPVEESVVYPAALALLGETQLQHMGEEMAARRRQ